MHYLDHNATSPLRPESLSAVTPDWRIEPNLSGQVSLADATLSVMGVPINVGNDTIGAVGVSGSSQTGDEACAKAGIAKVAEQLKTN